MQEILEELKSKGVLTSANPILEPLSGGVSSDVALLTDGKRRYVVKRALAQLRVKDVWLADVARNRIEHDYITYCGEFLPENFPKIFYHNPEKYFFLMEFVEGDFQNWKTLLLDGKTNPETAGIAGKLLGTIHARTWKNAECAEKFDTSPNFMACRADPYLLTTAQRTPALREIIGAEVERLMQACLALVHGDFSPKNLLVNPSHRFIILDCEVGWYGDPAFDIAFLLNHLVLKALYHSQTNTQASRQLLEGARAFWENYRAAFRLEARDPELDQRSARLLLMLMLARVDGKSPLEYLTDESQKAHIRKFCHSRIPKEPPTVDDLLLDWENTLSLPKS